MLVADRVLLVSYLNTNLYFYFIIVGVVRLFFLVGWVLLDVSFVLIFGIKFGDPKPKTKNFVDVRNGCVCVQKQQQKKKGV